MLRAMLCESFVRCLDAKCELCERLSCGAMLRVSSVRAVCDAECDAVCDAVCNAVCNAVYDAVYVQCAMKSAYSVRCSVRVFVGGFASR